MNKRTKHPADDPEFLNGPLAKSMSDFHKKWLARTPEEVAASKKKAEEYFQAYLAADIWFQFFDPYLSLFAKEKPQVFDRNGRRQFVDIKGKPVLFRDDADASRLLSLAADAAQEFWYDLDEPHSLTKEEWKELIKDAKQEIKEMRAAIPWDRLTFVNNLGEPMAKRDSSEIDSLEVVKIFQQLIRDHGASEFERKIVRKLLCLLCLREIDSAVLSAIHSDAGSGITSAIEASAALANAKSLRSTGAKTSLDGKTEVRVSTRAEISAHALKIRNSTRYAAQDWTWNEWVRIGQSNYANVKAAFARDYVVPKVPTLFQTAAGRPLEVTQKQVVEVWLKGPRPGSAET